ncbi:MAG: hypothetical protein JO152_01215, partial [Mycobacteriaceae bacterium]|nr:hypothetical protein [Mycobacteriaceae bacterium]
MSSKRGRALRLLAAAGILAACAVAGTPAQAKAGEPGETPFLQIRVDQVTPDVVTTTSEPVVTVTGTVTNVGDRPVRDIVVRLEHAAPVASSAELRTNLDGSTDQYEPVGEFVNVTGELLRGQASGFRLSYPVRST